MAYCKGYKRRYFVSFAYRQKIKGTLPYKIKSLVSFAPPHSGSFVRAVSLLSFFIVCLNSASLRGRNVAPSAAATLRRCRSRRCVGSLRSVLAVLRRAPEYIRLSFATLGKAYATPEPLAIERRLVSFALFNYNNAVVNGQDERLFWAICPKQTPLTTALF